MDIVVRKLERQGALSDIEKRALTRAFSHVVTYRRDQDFTLEGDPPRYVGALLEGWICRRKEAADGARQIVALPVPGDLFDMHGLLLETNDHSVSALGECRIATASPAAVGGLVQEHPRLGAMMWRQSAVEGAVSREWVLNCGRRSAYSRIAHLFCELLARLSAVGKALHGTFQFPLTQSDLADTTGLSSVHLNRVLQRLRTEGLVSLRGGSLQVHDEAGLAVAGDFSPAYLHDRKAGATAFHQVLGSLVGRGVGVETAGGGASA